MYQRPGFFYRLLIALGSFGHSQTLRFPPLQIGSALCYSCLRLPCCPFAAVVEATAIIGTDGERDEAGAEMVYCASSSSLALRTHVKSLPKGILLPGDEISSIDPDKAPQF
jgi:hypothetical protein